MKAEAIAGKGVPNRKTVKRRHYAIAFLPRYAILEADWKQAIYVRRKEAVKER